MTAAARKIEHARQLHNAGRWQEAERLYLQALDASPGETDGLHLLALLHADTGRPDTATQLLGAAIGIEGPKPHLCRNLGIILERQNKQEAAIACYRQAVLGEPNSADLWARMAELLSGLGRYGEAAQAWGRAIETTSAPIESQRILRIAPDHVASRFELGVVLMQLDRAQDAVSAFAAVVAAEPTHAQAHNNLAVLCHALSEHDRALVHYEQCLSLDPAYVEARYNFGTLLQERGDLEAATFEFQTVLAADPEHAAAWTNLGNCLLGCGEIAAALSCYGRTLALEPGETAAAWNAGIAHLTAGRFEQGWAGYERRFEVPGATPRRSYPMPLWHGEPLAGKTILVYAEQGLGDTLQFCRYLPLLADRRAKVYFDCPRSLAGLLGSLRTNPTLLMEPGSAAPTTDFYVPLLSVPAILKTDLDSIPASGGYLRAAPETRSAWGQRLEPLGRKLRVGFVSQGNPRYKNDRNRSIPAELFAPLGQVPGVALINLQFGRPVPASLHALDLSAEIGDFASTAGLVEEMDLVISVDTSMAHLAGAVGKETWVLLAKAADWRWMRDRDDSPWYPKARLFRQTESHDWASVLQTVAEALRTRVELALRP
ncbi:MAG: tetratricopeptide repeat protein [Acidobacteria bacterium]|nr:tetratricopeptide repeat protein [Acidobacteriota bacterium]